MALIVSFFGTLVVFHLGNASHDDYTAASAIIMLVATMVSVAALVTFSRTGWSVEGF